MQTINEKTVLPDFGTLPENVGTIYKMKDFYDHLYDKSREKSFHPPTCICTTKIFMNQFDEMNSDEKERTINAIKRIENEPIPGLFGDIIEEPDKQVVDVCGWRVLFSFNVGLDTLFLYGIFPGKNEKYTIKL